MRAVRCPVCRGRKIQIDPRYDPEGREPWECDECEGTGWVQDDTPRFTRDREQEPDRRAA